MERGQRWLTSKVSLDEFVFGLLRQLERLVGKMTLIYTSSQQVSVRQS